MDSLALRHNMVDRQVRTWEVLDQKTLNLMLSVAREDFVPTNFAQLAYADSQIPLGFGEVMLEPKIIGRILQALNLTGKEDILEVGTGSGYLSALLSKVSRHVTTIEINKPLALQAASRFVTMGLNNIEILCGNVMDIIKGAKSFDVVVLTGSLPTLPAFIANQVRYAGQAATGKVFAVLGQAPIMHACLFTRIKEDEWAKTRLFETMLTPLKEIINVEQFDF